MKNKLFINYLLIMQDLKRERIYGYIYF